MRFRAKSRSTSDFKLEMTAMIDIVFQLLVFFVMTFKVVAQEGELEMSSPQALTLGSSLDVAEQLALELSADDSGRLQRIRIGDRSFRDYRELNEFFFDLASRKLSCTVTIDCDYRLSYADTIRAIEATKRHQGLDGRVIQLDHTTRFAARK